MEVQSRESGAAAELRQTLGTHKIAFLVVASAAPLVAMVGTVPLSMAVGNGAGVPGAYLVATVTLVCFSVGYAAMARTIAGGGGFYAYIARGLGRPVAAAGAVLALIGYNGLVAALAGGIGYFLTAEGGAPGPWWAYSAAGIVVMAALGFRAVDLSAKVLAILLTCELGALLCFDLAVLADKGTATFTADSFAPSTVLSGAPGVAFMFAFGSFAGYEAAAIYAEESRAPARAVPRATYVAVLVMGVLYTLTSWLTIGALGPDRAGAAAEAQEGQLLFSLTGDILGPRAEAVLGVLIITSLFASVLASHNSASRYLFSLGRDRLAFTRLARVHPRHRSPYAASLAQSGFTLLVVAVFAAAGLDPYRNLVTIMSGLSTLGIVLLQMLAALACVAYFRRRRDRRIFRTLVIPLAGCVGLGTATALLLANFDVLAHSDSVVINMLPYMSILLAVAAAVYAVRLRGTDPDRYARIAAPRRVVQADVTTPTQVGDADGSHTR